MLWQSLLPKIRTLTVRAIIFRWASAIYDSIPGLLSRWFDFCDDLDVIAQANLLKWREEAEASGAKVCVCTRRRLQFIVSFAIGIRRQQCQSLLRLHHRRGSVALCFDFLCAHVKPAMPPSTIVVCLLLNVQTWCICQVTQNENE